MLVRVIKIYRSLFHRAEEENDSTMVLDPLLSTFLTTIPLFIRRFSFQISPLPNLSRHPNNIPKLIKKYFLYTINRLKFTDPSLNLSSIILEFHLIGRITQSARFFSNRVPEMAEENGQENSQK